MKKATNHIICTLVFLFLQVNLLFGSCEVYQLDLINNSLSGPTYTATCATNITPSQWEVRDDTCSLSSTPYVVPGNGRYATPITVRINKSGNLECDDWFKLEYAIDGVWYTQDSVAGCNLSSNVQDYNFNVVCGSLQTISIRVTYSNNGGSPEKWFLKNGDICISTPLLIMPIELVNFIAESQQNNTILKWTTATESNNNYFTIEKSADGINFASIGTVKGAGNSTVTKQYSFIDNQSSYGISYYRLKQTDFNHKYEYSKVVSVNHRSPENALKVYPNPSVSGEPFNVNYSNPNSANEEVLIVVLDFTGRALYSKVILQENDGVLVAIDPANKLNPGIYFVTGTSKNEIFRQRLVIIDNNNSNAYAANR